MERTVDEWFDELEYGLEYRYLYGVEKDWAKIEAMFYNGHFANQGSGPNIIYSTGDAFLSTIHTPNPQMLVAPCRVEEVEWAPYVEKMDNKLLSDMKLKSEYDALGLYAYLWGVGVLKLGYDSEFGYNPVLDIHGIKNPAGMTLTQFAKNQAIEYGDINPGMPWAKACLPHDIVVPWGTRDLNNCPWIAHRVVRHVDDIKADIKYSNKKNLKPVMSMRDFVESYQVASKPYRIGPDLLSTTTESTGHADYVELWEIHDKETRNIYVIATGHDKFLRKDTNYLQIKGLPFVELGFVPKGRTFWRTSDALYLLNHQAEISDITFQARKQRRMNVLKFMMKKDAMTEAEKRKLLSRDIGAVVEVDPKGGPMGDVFFPVPQSNANQGLYMEAEDVRSSARETVGFDRNSTGEYQGARTTAREVQAVQQAKDSRMTRRTTLLAEAYKETFRKINGIVFKFWTMPKVMQIMDQMGAMMWQQYVPAALQGNYDLDIVFNDDPIETSSSRQQLAMQAYQMSMQGDPSIDPVEVRRFLSRSFPDASVARLFSAISPMAGGANGQASPGQQPSGARRPAPARPPIGSGGN